MIFVSPLSFLRAWTISLAFFDQSLNALKDYECGKCLDTVSTD